METWQLFYGSHPWGSDDIHLAISFLRTQSPELVSSSHLTLLYSKTGFQKGSNYFLPFPKNFLCCVAPHSDVINIWQMFMSFPLYQCWISPWQMVGLFPLLWQPIPDVMNAPPSKSKLLLHSCCQRDWEKCIGDISGDIPLGCLWLQLILAYLACLVQLHLAVVWNSPLVSLYSPLIYCTGLTGLLNGKSVSLITPWLSSWQISWWMRIRESRLVWYCHWHTVVVMSGIGCSTLSSSTTEGSSERLGKVSKILRVPLVLGTFSYHPTFHATHNCSASGRPLRDSCK